MIDIYYSESGNNDGELMIFLHGGGVSGWMWNKQTEYFRNYHCIVPDLPGHGKSRNDGFFNFYNAAEEIIKLIKNKKNNKKVILIGFSLGAQLVVKILSMQPELIDFAVINSALVKPMKFTASLIEPSLKMCEWMLKNKKFQKIQAKTLYINNDMFESYFDDAVNTSVESLAATLKENMTFGFPENYSKASTKILILIGSKEKNIMKESGEILKKENKNAELIVVPEIGHGISLAVPDKFNKIVETFLIKN